MFFFSICFNNKSKSCIVFIYQLFFMKSTHTKKIPLAAAVVLRRSKAFKNRFEILQHIKNSGEEFHPSPASLSLNACTTVGGMNLRVRPRVDMFLKSNSLSGTHAPYSLLNSSNKVLWAKRFRKMEYRTRLLETVEDFFCQPNFNDSYF